MSRVGLNLWSLVAFVVAVLALAVSPPSATAAVAAQRAPAAIAGLVVNAEGAAVAGAEVRLVTPAGKVVETTRTGPKGRFEFAPVRPGAYLVQGAKKDVGRGEEKVVAKGGEVSRVKVTLKKK